ncbi:hypothetical protein IJ818_06410 [bacterium]|nr:hypothetical protein [bacterium]
MITSIGSSRETLAEILAKLNSPTSDSTASTQNTTGLNNSLNGLKSVDDLSLEFQENLMNFLMKTKDTTKENSTSEIGTENDNSEIVSKLGIPAGLDLEQNLESNSLVEKIKNMNFLKAFDLDKDGSLTKNDFNIAKEKSPLVSNVVNAYNSAIKNNSTIGSQASNFIQSMINQYKDNPLNLVAQAAEIFA